MLERENAETMLKMTGGTIRGNAALSDSDVYTQGV